MTALLYVLAFSTAGWIASVAARRATGDAAAHDDEALAEWLWWWGRERFRCAVHAERAPVPGRGSYRRWVRARTNIDRQLTAITELDK